MPHVSPPGSSAVARLAAASIAALVLAGGALSAQAPQPSRLAAPPTAAPNAHRLSESYGRLPLHFEKNTGQVDARTDFLARGKGYNLFLRSTGAVLGLRTAEASRTAVLELQLAGANSRAHVSGLDPLPGRVNYFIGNDPAKWRTNIPTFGRVEYDEVYPGIDLAYYGNQGQIEFDFVVAPGADPTQIAMSFAGAQAIRLDPNGDLVLSASGGELRQHKPVVYQDVDGTRRPVEGRYVMKGARQVAFDVGAYDARLPLVIDPILVYSTYLGGSAADVGNAIAVDAAGSAYVTGVTVSPAATFGDGALQLGAGGGNDVFVAKLSASGSTLLYATYLGGASADTGRGIAVDVAGNAYVTGLAGSGFPTIPGAFDVGPVSGTDAFVAKLDPTGSALVYSTLLGNVGTDEGHAIAVDGAGNAYVTGVAAAAFPITGAGFGPAGAVEAFVTKVNAAGSGLVYSRLLGGSGTDRGHGIAVDSADNAFVTGETVSANFPITPGAYDTSAPAVGRFDAFVTKVNAAGSALVYSTFLGGDEDDEFGRAIAIDAAGHAYLAGQTFSTGAVFGASFPTTAGAVSNALSGVSDAFVTKVNPGGTGLLYSTYLGGASLEDATGIAVDALGYVHVTGETRSADFPTMSPPGSFSDTTQGGSTDAFVTTLNLGGGVPQLVYSTHLGGAGAERGNAIVVGGDGSAYVTGLTASSGAVSSGSGSWTNAGFPIIAGSYDTTYGGSPNNDAFVAKFAAIALSITLDPVDATNNIGTEHCVTALVENQLGNPIPGVTVYFTVSGATTTSGSGVTDASGQTEFCYTGPAVPGADVINAYPDANNNAVQDPSEPTATATKTWADQFTTTTTVTSSGSPSMPGEPVTFMATVSAAVPVTEGTVTFQEGATVLAGPVPVDAAGQASFVTAALSVATHTITAYYSGAAAFTASSDSVDHTVAKSDTTTTVTSSFPVTTPTYGEVILFTATVAPVPPASGIPSGSVAFFDGTTAPEDLLGTSPVNAFGQAFLATSTLVAGAHEIIAVYSGNAFFNASTSPEFPQFVDSAATTTTISASLPSPTVYGQPVTFTAVVAVDGAGVETPTGEVVFSDGVTVLATVPLDDEGEASIALSSLAVAAHFITAEYEPADSNFEESATSTAHEHVVGLASTTTQVVSNPNPSEYGAGVTISATVTAVPPGARTLAFSGPMSVFAGTGAGTFGLASADFDGDGVVDLATANRETDDVSILFGNPGPTGKGDGTFDAPVSYPLGGGTAPVHIVAAHLNPGTNPGMDNFLDLVTVNAGNNSLSVLLGGAAGTFSAAVPLATSTRPGSVTVADVNGDGKPDLVVSNAGNGSAGVQIRLGDGLGGFGGAANLITDAGALHVQTGDFRRVAASGPPNDVSPVDGHTDILTVNFDEDTLTLRINNGTGGFASLISPALVTPDAGPLALVVADLNDDLRLDAVTANRTSRNVTVGLYNPLTGSLDFTDRFPLATSDDSLPAIPEFMVGGDFNGDGYLDLAVTDSNHSRVGILTGTGTGAFEFPMTFDDGVSPRTYGAPPAAFAENAPGRRFLAADFNGDGKLDLAFTTHGSDVKVLLNIGVGPIGTIEFFSDDMSLGSAPIVNGVATLQPPITTLVPGSHTLRATYASDGNYADSIDEATHVVAPIAIEVTADPQTKVYGDADPGFTYHISSGALIAGDLEADVFTGGLTREPGPNVGTYDILQGTLAISPAYADTYVLTFVGAELAITPRPVTATADPQTRFYGDADPPLTFQITSGSLVFSDAFTGELARVAGEDAGTYAIEQGTLALSANYDLTYVGADLTITPRPVTVAADPPARFYGDSDPPLTYQITSGSLVFGDGFTGGLIRVPGDHVGVYAIEQGTLALTPNYDLTYVGADLTITPRPVTVTADPQTRIYGNLEPELTYQITSGTLAFSDAFTGGLTRVAGENVGVYAIEQGTLALSFNYDLTYVGADLTITPREVTVTAYPWTKVYGDADPSLDYEITSGSLVFGDGFSGAPTRAAGENVGTYAIQQGTLALGLNYALTFVGADLTITARPVTVTADAQTKVYGNADPALTYQITSGTLVFGDVVAGALTRAPGEDVGSYAIQQGTLALSSNYDLTYQGDNLTIKRRPVQIIVDPQTKVYGDVDPPLTYQITSGSLAAGDAFSGALTRAPGEDVAIYDIDQGTLALSTNYDLLFVMSHLTITPRPVTVTADLQARVYGNADPALTYQITSGTLAFSDAFTGALTRAPGANVGTYAIQQGTLALDANYTLTFVGANLTITARPLNVTADDKSRPFGQPNPLLTGQVVGLVAGDAVTVTYSTPADASSSPGTYPIVPSVSDGGSGVLNNYNLTVTNGTLTVTPIAPGRMTGGGTFGSQRVHHGFTLHCNPQGSSNNLQVNWGKGNKFHLDQVTSADCSDRPGIAPGQPGAGFDTYRGTGIGRYNGAPATAEWTFTDAGEPGKNDTATIVIRNAAGQIVLSASGKISNGNHQAH